MARLPRYIIPGQPQHVIQRAANKWGQTPIKPLIADGPNGFVFEIYKLDDGRLIAYDKKTGGTTLCTIESGQIWPTGPVNFVEPPPLTINITLESAQTKKKRLEKERKEKERGK